MASLFTNVVMESSSCEGDTATSDRKSTRLNSSHSQISYAVFCLKKKKEIKVRTVVLLEDHVTSRTGRGLSLERRGRAPSCMVAHTGSVAVGGFTSSAEAGVGELP